MTISQLAKCAGVGSETVRYYQRIGLLRTPRRITNGFRSYSDDDARHLQFIRRAQRIGFTLEEVGALLQLSLTNCKDAERLTKERLEAIRAQIADLRRLEAALERTVDACEHRLPKAACPLVEALLKSP